MTPGVDTTNTDSGQSLAMVFTNGFAYTLKDGNLLACEVQADGTSLEQSGDKPNWVQVDGFGLEPAVQRDIDAAFTALLLLDTEAQLVAEYEQWHAAEKLPHVSADEHAAEALTPSQRRYLKHFALRWERVMSQPKGNVVLYSHEHWRQHCQLAVRDAD